MDQQNQALGNTGAGRSGRSDFFRVGRWTVEAPLNRLVLAGRAVQLEPKIMEVLVVLAANAGHLTLRSEILQEVWGGTHLAEDPMTRAISELRKVFGDDPKMPQFIETIHGKGYRLVAQVVAEDEAAQGTVDFPQRRSRHLKWKWALWGALVATTLTAVIAIYLLRVGPGPGHRSFSDLRQIPITSYPGLEIHPALSPEGSRVAFVREMGDGKNTDVFIKQRNTEQPLRLTATPHLEHGPVWSPDGTEIAFVRLAGDECGIFAIPAIGGPERLLYSCERNPLGYDWSPDGLELVIAERSFGDEGAGLTLLEIASGQRQRITTPPSSTYLDTSPNFSPSGREIAFRRGFGVGSFEIVVLDRSTGEIREITSDRRDNGGFAWSSDGKDLIVSSNRSGVFALWKVRVSTGYFEWLGFENAYLPSIAAGGRGLVFEKRSFDLDLWRAPNPHRSAAGESSRWASSTRYDIEPQFSPDGNRVAFVSQRTGSYELWVASADGQDARQLTFFDKPAPAWNPSVQHPRWTSDGAQILFSARDEDDFDVFTVRAEGGSPRPLTSSVADDLSPVWMSDENWIYFASNRTGTWLLWRVSSDGGRSEEVSDEIIIPTLESNGGETLYYGAANGGIKRFSTRRDRSEDRSPVETPVDLANWCLVSGGLYYLAEQELTYYDFATHRSESWSLPDAKIPAGGVAVIASSLSISPDGQWLLYSGIGQREADVMLVDAEF